MQGVFNVPVFFQYKLKLILQNDLQKKIPAIGKLMLTICKIAFVSQQPPYIISRKFKESKVSITGPTFLACQVTLRLGAGSSIAHTLARQLIEKQIWSIIQNT